MNGEKYMTQKEMRRTTEKYDAMEAFIERAIEMLMQSDAVVIGGIPSKHCIQSVLEVWSKEDLIG